MRFIFFTLLLASCFKSFAQTHFQKRFWYPDGIGLTSAQQTQGGGFIMSCNIGVAGTADNAIIEVDSVGNIKWSKTYDGGFGDVTRHILRTSDNGFIFTGTKWNNTTNSGDISVIKLDDTGKVQWSRCYATVYPQIDNWIFAGWED